MPRPAPLGALFLALSAQACAGDAPHLPPPPPPPATAPSPEPPPHRVIRRLLDSEPHVVVIAPEASEPRDVARSVVLHGYAGTRQEVQLVPHPAGGAWAFESVDTTMPHPRVVQRHGETTKDLLLPSGDLVGLGTIHAQDLGRYVFADREQAFALLDAETGREVGSRAKDPAHDTNRSALPLPPEGSWMVEQLFADAGSGLEEEVRASRVPSLSPLIVRRGHLGALAGRFALVSVPGKPPPPGTEAPVQWVALEIVDLPAGKVIDTIRLPRPLRQGASMALSADGVRLAVAHEGGVDLYERASRRWVQKRRPEKTAEGVLPPNTSVGFTADGNTLCLRHGGVFLFPPAPAPEGTRRRVVFDSDRRGFYDGTCIPAATPQVPGAEPLVEESYRFQLQHHGDAISPGHDLGAFLDVEKVPAGADTPREVRLTVVELPASKVRYQISVGRWTPGSAADHLTVSFLPGGVSVYATVEPDQWELVGGLFDAATGRKLAPLFTPGPEAPPFADLARRAGYLPGPGRWSKVRVEKGALVAEDAQGNEVTLAHEEPLPKKATAWLGGRAGGITVVGDGGVGGWLFSTTEKRLLGELVPAGKGVVALLDGGAFDTAGPVDDASLGCLQGSRLLPISACRDRTFVPGALAEALAGTEGWLDETR